MLQTLKKYQKYNKPFYGMNRGTFGFLMNKFVSSNLEKIKLTLAAIVSEGSILIEDYPGSGKTTFAKAITQSLGLDFKRLQFTSDLLPSETKKHRPP